jgi:D-alanyl-D-alanine carboxypeptidase
MDNPIFAKTVSTRSVTVGNRYLTNHNKLLWRVEGADGVKTGYTRAAGRILVSSATRDDRRIIAATINDGDDWNDHARLLNEGFSRFEVKPIVLAGDYLDILEVAGGENRQVEILAAEDFSFPLADEEKPYTMIPGPGFAYAPVVEGADAGVAYILIGKKAVGKIPVVYGRTVEQQREESKGVFEKLFRR